MASKPPVFCEICNEPTAPGEELEDHLVSEHDPRELADRIAADWEAEEFHDFE